MVAMAAVQRFSRVSGLAFRAGLRGRADAGGLHRLPRRSLSDQPKIPDPDQKKLDRVLSILEELKTKNASPDANEKIKELEDRLTKLEVHAHWGGIIVGIVGAIAIAITIPGVCYSRQNVATDVKEKQVQMEKEITNLKSQIICLESYSGKVTPKPATGITATPPPTSK